MKQVFFFLNRLGFRRKFRQFFTYLQLVRYGSSNFERFRWQRISCNVRPIPLLYWVLFENATSELNPRKPNGFGSITVRKVGKRRYKIKKNSPKNSALIIWCPYFHPFHLIEKSYNIVSFKALERKLPFRKLCTS